MLTDYEYTIGEILAMEMDDAVKVTYDNEKIVLFLKNGTALGIKITAQ